MREIQIRTFVLLLLGILVFFSLRGGDFSLNWAIQGGFSRPWAVQEGRILSPGGNLGGKTPGPQPNLKEL